MRFKLYYDDGKKALDINCLPDKNEDKILPENPSQHVYYPIPNKMKDLIHAELVDLIETDAAKEFQKLGLEIKALTDARKELLNNMRTELNPKIMQQCTKFKENHAEHFI
jgi:hypothetical protein